MCGSTEVLNLFKLKSFSEMLSCLLDSRLLGCSSACAKIKGPDAWFRLQRLAFAWPLAWITSVTCPLAYLSGHRLFAWIATYHLSLEEARYMCSLDAGVVHESHGPALWASQLVWILLQNNATSE